MVMAEFESQDRDILKNLIFLRKHDILICVRQ